MQFLKDFFAQQHKHFDKGGKLERFYPFFEMTESFIFTPGKVTQRDAHVRDFMDLKRVMVLVVLH